MFSLERKKHRNSRLIERSRQRRLRVVRAEELWSRLALQRPDVRHSYLSHREINQYLDFLARRFAEYVQVHTVGYSHERRPIKAVEIDWKDARKGSPATTAASVPSAPMRNLVFIEGGTHGREWISITTALSCICQLTEKNLRNRDVLRKMRFLIVPLSNPDGYEYSRSKNRQWRKNRRPSGSLHIGTDCNRNYDIHWELGNARHSRNTFKGDRPFSEPETRALRNVLVSRSSELLLFLSLHSYAQSIMYPWGISFEVPESLELLHTVACNGRDAIGSVNGRKYNVGSIAQLSNHTITGSIVDYAFGIIKVPICMVMELPSAQYGFQPPASQIDPIGTETWVGIRRMCLDSYRLLPEYLAKTLEAAVEMASASVGLAHRLLSGHAKDAQVSLVRDMRALSMEGHNAPMAAYRIRDELPELLHLNESNFVPESGPKGQPRAKVCRLHKQHSKSDSRKAGGRATPTEPPSKRRHSQRGTKKKGSDARRYISRLMTEMPLRVRQARADCNNNDNTTTPAKAKKGATGGGAGDMRRESKVSLNLGYHRMAFDLCSKAERAAQVHPRRFNPVRMEELAKPKVPPKTIHYREETLKKLLFLNGEEPPQMAGPKGFQGKAARFALS